MKANPKRVNVSNDLFVPCFLILRLFDGPLDVGKHEVDGNESIVIVASPQFL